MRITRQFSDMPPEQGADGAAEQQTILLEHTADLILKIAPDADQARSRDQHRADSLAALAFDLHLTKPADAHELSTGSGHSPA